MDTIAQLPLKSRFKLWSILIIAGVILLLTWILAMILHKLYINHKMPPFAMFVFLTFFFIAWNMLVFGELRINTIKVKIKDDEIVASNYLGLGLKKTYSFSGFEGFIKVIKPSKYSSYEYLYLLKNGKRVICLSQFYHSNYSDLKKCIEDKVPDLGYKGFHFGREMKQLFS